MNAYRSALNLTALAGALMLASLASADNITRRAQIAVNNLIQDRYGRDFKVNFQTTLGDRENAGVRHFEGRGYTREGRRSRDFRYSLDVRRGGDEVRDVRVRFDDGTDLRSRGDWFSNDERRGPAGRPDGQPGRPGGGLGDVRFDQPSNDFTDLDGKVDFSGRAYGRDVVLRILDRNGREIVRRNLDVGGDRRESGSWHAQITLADGDYRAEVTQGRDRDEVRFRVRSSDRNVRDEDRVEILRPESRDSLREGSIRFEGKTLEREVTVEIRDDRGRTVTTRRVNADRDRWRTDIRLARGEYTLRVTVPSGRDLDERRFTVSR